MKKTILIGCAFLSQLTITAQTVEGYVYEDNNQNGLKEQTETGISDVAVSNGVNVVLTDEEGKYKLPLKNDAIISVIKPSGYKVMTDENNLPQFFYTHKPNGSPDLEFKGSAPTGKLPKSVDFGLVPSEENQEFTVLIFGDPQPYNLKEIGYFKKGIIAELEGVKNVAFGLSLGDLVGNDLDLFNPYIEAVKQVGVPWYNLLGNHDLNFDARTDPHSDETYEVHFGPANYAFNYGKVHFIILDDVLYPDPRGKRKYWGGFRKDQLEFIKNDLKHVPKNQLVVLAFHIPISEPNEDSFRDQDRKKLFNLLKRFPHTLSLSAHTHIQRQDFFGKEKGWKQDTPHHHYNVGTTSGDWYSGKLNQNGIPISTMRDGTPNGYSFIHFDGNQYSIQYKAAGKPKDFQMKISAPKVVAKGRRTQAGIFVNFFMGSKNDNVRYRIDNGKWKEMTRMETADPSYVELVHEWDTAKELMPGRRSSNPVISTHVWRGKIPTDLETGTHRIEVKVTDMYGKTYTSESNYRLEEPK